MKDKSKTLFELDYLKNVVLKVKEKEIKNKEGELKKLKKSKKELNRKIEKLKKLK